MHKMLWHRFSSEQQYVWALCEQRRLLVSRRHKKVHKVRSDVQNLLRKRCEPRIIMLHSEYFLHIATEMLASLLGDSVHSTRRQLSPLQQFVFGVFGVGNKLQQLCVSEHSAVLEQHLCS